MSPVNKIGYRNVVRYLGNGSWASCEFEELKKGDTFKLFEQGRMLGGFTAMTDPYPEHPSGNWGIVTEPWNSPA
jgi:hypothetical protein